MYGCCAPEGMRAIYTTWSNTIERFSESSLGAAGVYVNMSFKRESEWGDVFSFMPEEGRLMVKTKVDDLFFLRIPHWVPHDQVHAFKNTQSIPVLWSGDYVRFKARKGDELTITYPLISFMHKVEGLWGKVAKRPDLKLTFKWLGNMVVSVDPPPRETALFTGKPRILPVFDLQQLGNL